MPPPQEFVVFDKAVTETDYLLLDLDSAMAEFKAIHKRLRKLVKILHAAPTFSGRYVRHLVADDHGEAVTACGEFNIAPYQVGKPHNEFVPVQGVERAEGCADCLGGRQ